MSTPFDYRRCPVDVEDLVRLAIEFSPEEAKQKIEEVYQKVNEVAQQLDGFFSRRCAEENHPVVPDAR
ncbi:MAG: hypothetical protein N2Z84_05070 [Atribacterota bacterium]|nr:hypothetical protein [Atribacterota bacterium]